MCDGACACSPQLGYGAGRGLGSHRAAQCQGHTHTPPEWPAGAHGRPWRLQLASWRSALTRRQQKLPVPVVAGGSRQSVGGAGPPVSARPGRQRHAPRGDSWAGHGASAPESDSESGFGRLRKGPKLRHGPCRRSRPVRSRGCARVSLRRLRAAHRIGGWTPFPARGMPRQLRVRPPSAQQTQAASARWHSRFLCASRACAPPSTGTAPAGTQRLPAPQLRT